MPFLRQADFTGGEIDPRLYGKTTHQKYPTFVRRLSNFIAIPQGAAMNRTGTIYVAAALDPTQAPRLIPFLWPSQNYLLEVSAGTIRIWANGVFVTSVISTVITRPTLNYLKYAQANDVLTICYGGEDPGGEPAFAPQDLRRISHAVWTIAATGFAAPAATGSGFISDVNGAAVAHPLTAIPDATHQAQPWDWAFTLTVRSTATGGVSETGIIGKLSNGTGAYPTAYNAATAYLAGDVATYNGSLWTSLQGANTGHQPDTNPTWWTLGVVVGADTPVHIGTWGTGAAPAGYQIIEVNVYRGKNGTWGFVDSAGTQAPSHVTDIGDTPNYALEPPQSTDPFATYDASGALTGHDYPACVTHYQQRRVFARQLAHLGRVRGSKPANFNDFDVTDIAQDSDAINFDLASQAIEDIRSLVSARALIVLTSTGATVVRGSGSQRGGSTAITPSSVDATKQGTRGASWVDPVVVDNTILYPGSKGAAIHAASYDPFYEVLTNTGSDVALVAQHFLRGHSIIDMAWQESPNSLVWLVRDDGLLLGLTFVPAAQPDDAIHGWHQHPTNGTVQRICSVQEGIDDVLYLVVQRAGALLIERMATRTLPQITVPAPTDEDQAATKTIDDVRLAIFLDASLGFDGRNVGATTMQFVSDAGTYAGGEEGTITASAAAFVGASDEGDVVVLDPNGAGGGPFGLTILSFTDTTHARAILNAPLPAAFQVATTSWGWARDTMANLGHLEGQSVMALADGGVQGPFTVVGGQIALTTPAVIVTAGLAYTSDLELLDIIPDQVRANVKAIPRVVLEVVASRGVLAGEDDAHLKPWRTRDPPDTFGNPPLVTDQIEVRISSTWNRGGRALIRQTDPLPLVVTAASRELTIGGA